MRTGIDEVPRQLPAGVPTLVYVIVNIELVLLNCLAPAGQRDFFDVGPEQLKILRMSDLAGELECDPSTVSRTVADKYMQTPRGIYPLRYFFTGGTETQDGESMGWDRVKTRVRELVDAEDKESPLNDDQIAALLKEEGIVISRRTVAKYRQQLDIPAARQRRKFT